MLSLLVGSTPLAVKPVFLLDGGSLVLYGRHHGVRLMMVAFVLPWIGSFGRSFEVVSGKAGVVVWGLYVDMREHGVLLGFLHNVALGVSR